MKREVKSAILFFILMAFLSFKQETADSEINSTSSDPVGFVGEWDNFQQYWLENTAEDKHRVTTDDKHRHFSLRVDQGENGDFVVELREGRNGKNLVEKMTLEESDLSGADFNIDGDTLYVGSRSPFENKDPYRFIRARKFSGWIEYPMESAPDGIYHQGNLEISDQGGMVQLDLEGVDYTVELTQLLFAKKLAIMKLAVYDIPMDSVDINSRSISYTWLNPDAKRTGINLRKVITGWTFIEPGFVNQNTWRKEKEE